MTEFNIDPEFSVYQLAKRRSNISMVISRRQTMSKVSYIIEESTRTDGVDNIIFASFQYMSKFIPQIHRYQGIAKNAKHVYVFGVPDVKVPAIDNVTYVPISPDDKLAKEWFVVSHGADFSTALVTEELSNFHDPDDQRQFNGFWIFNDGIIPILYEWLLNVVGNRAEDHHLSNIHSTKSIEVMKQLSDRYEIMLDTHKLDRLTLTELVFYRAHTIKPMVAYS